jgi:2-methylcitrate dehydratase PrpD
MNPTISEKLAAIALDTKADDIPSSAYQAAIKFLVDTFGCAIAGRNQPGINEVRELFSGYGGTPEAAVFFSDVKLPLAHASFVNSAMIHALDYDDVYVPGTLHLSSTIVAPVLGAAKINGLSGKEFLAAIIVAVEVAGQLGIAERAYRRGQQFLPSTLINGFGAVAGMARAYGLDKETTIDALGLNYAQICGNRQALLDKTTAKRLQGAFAARNAVYAVDLARSGITGPKHSFEGDAGYCRCYLDGAYTSDDVHITLNDLQIEHVSFKRYPSCGACHNVQIAAENLMKKEKLSPDKIERVEIFGCSEKGIVGGKFTLSRTPQADVQFSAVWAVAHAIVRGHATLKDYQNESIVADREVIEFCDRISFTAMPDGLAIRCKPAPYFPDFYAKPQGIIVYTKDNRKLIKCQAPADTSNPANFPLEFITNKYNDCCDFSGLANKRDFNRLLDAILNVRKVERLDDLIDAICLAK